MTNEKELANVPQGGALANPDVDSEALAILTQSPMSRNFLNLAQGMTKEVSCTGISPGQFFISHQDKTKSVPVGTFKRDGGKLRGVLPLVYLAYRAKATLYRDNKPLFESYKFHDPIFQKILNAKTGHTPEGKVRTDIGTEVLVYVPPHAFDFESMRNDKKRGLSEDDIAALERQYTTGALATFFFKGTNRENTLGGSPEEGGVTPGTALALKSEEVPAANPWWKTPIRSTYENQSEEWMIKGRESVTEQTINDFMNPPKRGGGEAITDNEASTSTEDAPNAPIGR